MSAEPQSFDWLPEGNWVDLGYDNAPTESQLRSQIDAGEHNDAYGDLGCPDCGNVDLFWKTHSSKGQRYRCLSCEYSSNWETVKSQGDLTLQKFGLTVDCPLCDETISAYNRASIDSHFRKHKKEAAEASEPKVSEAEYEWQEEIEWNEKSKKKTEPEWEDVEWESETRRCCECHTTEGLTTIQAGTFCYGCLPINLGAESEDDYWAGSVAKAIVNEMGDDYYDEDLHEYNCVHFAQEMSEYLAQDGIPHEIQNIAGYGGEVAHAWVYVPSEKEYYDAWTPYGVSDWKDLGFWETLDYKPEWLEQQTPVSFEAEEPSVETQDLLNWVTKPIIQIKLQEDLAQEPLKCLWCGEGAGLESDTPEHEEGGIITSVVGCNLCGCVWREEYKYVGNEIIEPGEEDKIMKAESYDDEQLEIEIEGIDETYGLITPDSEMLSLAESAVSQYQSRTDLPETFQLHTKPHFVFVSAEAFGRSSHVARFRSQTASHIPIIMLSSDAIRESADQYGVSLETAVATTVWHELGHLLCELWDMEDIYPFDNSNQEEEFAESIAESMYFQEPFQNPEV